MYEVKNINERKIPMTVGLYGNQIQVSLVKTFD